MSAPLDLSAILKDLGVVITGGTEEELYTLCPLHKDSSASMSINTIDGKWVCYRGCGGGNNIFSLASAITGDEWIISFRKYRKMIRQVSSNELLNLITRSTDTGDMPELDYTTVFGTLKKSFPKWFIDRGFGIDTIKEFDIYGNPEDASIVIPAYDHRDKLVGTVSRLSPKESNRLGYKYVLSKGLDKTKMFFAGNVAARKSFTYNTTRAVCITEGSLDAMWLHRFGLPAIALLGSSLSNNQINILRNHYKPKEIYLFLDNDNAGIKAMPKIVKRLMNDYKLWSFIYPPEASDPQELTEQQILNAQFESPIKIWSK